MNNKKHKDIDIQNMIRNFVDEHKELNTHTCLIEFAKQLRQINLIRIREAVDSDPRSKIHKELIIKAKNHAERWGEEFTNEYFQKFCNEIKQSDFFAQRVAKDPTKQAYQEYLQQYVIINKSLFDSLENFSNKNLQYCHNGSVVRMDKKEADKYGYKTIDAKVMKDGVEYYICQKHTTSNGGGQDNQKNDGIEFLKQANKSDGTIKFIFLCDGDYYDNNNRREELRNQYPNVIVSSSDEIEKHI